jgi:hypothetical protein
VCSGCGRMYRRSECRHCISNGNARGAPSNRGANSGPPRSVAN